MNSAGIDTSALLTMLGLIAAVWAIVPNTAKLTFQLSLNKLDWVIIWSILLIVHGLFFEPVLTTLGFPNLGPWRWGFDKSAAQYSLFLALAAYVYFRSRRTKLTRWNLGLFDELSTTLLHAGKFEELADLLQRHLEPALNLAAPVGVRSSLADAIRPARPGLQIVRREDGTITLNAAESNWLSRRWFRIREALADLVGPSQKVQRRAVVVVSRILSSRGLTAHLAISRPYFCIKIIEDAARFSESFQDDFFNALLANESSILYSEIKNNHNFGGSGNRLALPEENRLLRFYCVDVSVAGRLGVYQAVGEAVLARIEADEALKKKLNGPMLSFKDVGKDHDPVYAATMFFRIMVLEGLHQRVANHLWLHYLSYFADYLVDQARELRREDSSLEFATPLGYLLYEIVHTAAVWIAEAETLTSDGDTVDSDQRDGNHVHISFEAAQAIGRIIRPILMSPRITQGLKNELLGVALSALRQLEIVPRLDPLAEVMRSHLIEPNFGREPNEYLFALRQAFNAQDSVLRMQLRRFNEALTAALSETNDH